MAGPDSEKDAPIPLWKALEEEYTEMYSLPAPEYPDGADEQTRLAIVLGAVHALDKKRSALCLSGGGIRSATFNLGVIQGLAKNGLLEQFDYVSTVSGGGYIGGWLSAWTARHQQGVKGVADELTKFSADKIDPESKPILCLRNYSNYLTPRIGFLNADTWTLVATFLRNLLLNWLVLLPLFAAVLMLPRIYISVFNWGDIRTGPLPNLTLAAGLAFILLAVYYICYDLPSLGDHRKSQKRFLFGFLLPLVSSAILLSIYWAWHRTSPYRTIVDVKEFALLGAAIHAGSWLALIGLNDMVQRKFRDLKVIAKLTAAAGASGALGGMLAWIIAYKLFPNPNLDIIRYSAFAPPLLLIVFLLVGLLFVGAVSKITSDEDREWWARSSAWVLIFIVLWGIGSALVIYGPKIYLSDWHPAANVMIASFGGISGLISALLGYSSKTPAGPQQNNKKGAARRAVLMLTAVLFIIAFLSAISLGTTWLLSDRNSFPGLNTHLETMNASRPQKLACYFSAMAALGLLSGFFINANKFSLHAMYRNRLMRAYLGASRDASQRKPSLFTGFDPDDNIFMKDLPVRPFHVINTALNTVGGERLAWQQRKAESFTVTRLHAGSARLGYRTSKKYGGGESAPISLGTAVAISGAAASPNMGYHSSPLITFIMSLFNVRLGWWLGNPSGKGERTWRLKGPTVSVWPLVQETFGLTTNESRYVYLSDGGHFENLGLYEMVLRRCHFIFVSDAGCDPASSFDDLGNAIRKIRIDLGVPIDVDFSDIASGTKRCVIGEIDYKSADGGQAKNGILVYIKPVICGRETADVLNYHTAYSDFPHQTTADQWFDESQFESYRALGLFSMEDICREVLHGQPLGHFYQRYRFKR